MAEQDQKQPGEEAQEPAATATGQESDATDPAAAGAGNGEPEELATGAPQDPVTELEQALTIAKDEVLRAQAEAQNTMRRAAQDVDKARKFALERFCSELLPVVDNLERAVEAAAGDEEILKPIAEGVELTLRSFLDALKKFQIEPVDPEGEPFDPQLHQAMTMVENAEVEPNTVTAVMQKGYTLNGRLVRPAMVIVSKSPE